MAFIVVYDANVLYPNTLRDLLIRISQAGPPAQARSPPRRGQNSRRQKAKPGPDQVITLTH